MATPPWRAPMALADECGAAGRGIGPARAHRAEAGQPSGGGGLLRSTRGAGGGLALARAASAISLAEIIEAVEGPIALTPCVDKGRADCSLEQGCAVRPHWPIVNDALRGALAGVRSAGWPRWTIRCKRPRPWS
jgi:hypothetical protein